MSDEMPEPINSDSEIMDSINTKISEMIKEEYRKRWNTSPLFNKVVECPDQTPKT